MSWSNAMITALSQKVLRPFYLFHLETTEAPLALSSRSYDLTWDSKTWIGNGWFRGLSSIKLNESSQSNSIDIVLAGASSSAMSIALSKLNQSKLGLIYLGLLDENRNIIADPTVLYAGFYSKAEIGDTPNSSILSITLQPETNRIMQPSDLRYTDAAQKNLFPGSGDQGLEYVAGLPDSRAFFGKAE